VFDAGPDIPDSVTNRWKIDEGSGTTLSDSEGSQSGTVNGATWVSGSKYTGGYALDHDSSDDWTVSDNAIGINDTQFSVAFWVNLDSYPDYARFASATSSQDPSINLSSGWTLVSDTNNQPKFRMDDAGAGSTYDTALSLNTDYFLGVAGDTSTGDGVFYIYDTSSQLKGESLSGSSYSGDNRYLRLMVGDDIYPGGKLDDVFISTTTMWSQSEFETIWETTMR
jgi:hypothetical protein